MLDPTKAVYDRFLYQAPALLAAGRLAPNWLEDGSRFEYTVQEGETQVRFQVDPEQKTCLRLPVPTPASQPLTETASTLEPRSFPWLLGNPLQESLSPDGKWFLGVEAYNLYLRSTIDGTIHRLTQDGSADSSWDALGARWSPDGKYLAARLVFIGDMLPLPVLHWLEKPEAIEMVRFARAGDPAWNNELVVIDIETGACQKIETGAVPPDYLNIVGFLPGEIVFAVSDRLCKQLNLMAGDLQSGRSRLILAEKHATFHNYQFFDPLPITPLSDGQHFIWLSERDGWSRLYLYDLQGHELACLNQGPYSVYQVTALDESAGWVYFTALADKRTYDLHLYRVRLDGSGFTQLTAASGNHEIQFSPSKRFFLDTHSTVDRPLATELRSADGTFIQELVEMDISPLLAAGWQPPQEFWVKAADGVTDLHGVLYKPGNFDASVRYPVIEYIYGGPHTLDVPNSFYAYSFLEALAQVGFVVYVVDGRGTIGRGKAFQDMCYGQVGQHEIPEHVHVLRQLLAAHPYMDPERVGIFGLSMGGYNTLRAMLTAPEIYKVGIATCAPPRLEDQAWAYIERFMGSLPQDQPAAYQKGSCFEMVGNLQGRLLLIHGTIDTNAPIAHTFQLMQAFIEAGKPVDMLIVPEQPHLFQGKSSQYWLDAIRRYFQEHL